MKGRHKSQPARVVRPILGPARATALAERNRKHGAEAAGGLGAERGVRDHLRIALDGRGASGAAGPLRRARAAGGRRALCGGQHAPHDRGGAVPDRPPLQQASLVITSSAFPWSRPQRRKAQLALIRIESGLRAARPWAFRRGQEPARPAPRAMTMLWSAGASANSPARQSRTRARPRMRGELWRGLF